MEASSANLMFDTLPDSVWCVLIDLVTRKVRLAELTPQPARSQRKLATNSP